MLADQRLEQRVVALLHGVQFSFVPRTQHPEYVKDPEIPALCPQPMNSR
jgi:hypothetical protein